jgi:nitrous oxide reductase
MPELEAQHGPSRRSVLWGAAGAGVAGIAATTLVGSAALPAMAATSAARDADAGTGEAGTTDQIVVHVRNARSGEIDVFRGTSQTRLHDPDLAARLLRASR